MAQFYAELMVESGVLSGEWSRPILLGRDRKLGQNNEVTWFKSENWIGAGTAFILSVVSTSLVSVSTLYKDTMADAKVGFGVRAYGVCMNSVLDVQCSETKIRPKRT